MTIDTRPKRKPQERKAKYHRPGCRITVVTPTFVIFYFSF